MFSILIHDEFHDSPPELWEDFDDLTEAVGVFNLMKTNDTLTRYGDGIELVIDTEDDQRICLEYHQLES